MTKATRKKSKKKSDITATDKRAEAEIDLSPAGGDEVVSPEIEVLPPESENEMTGFDSDIELEPEIVDDEEESGSRGLVRYDALSAYLKEISKFRHLNREEETALALKYYQNKDIEAAYKLISSNLWLVVKIAREYEKAARTVMDLIQEGNIGLMEAVRNFDPYRGVRFPSYAVWWVKAYIIRFVIANWRMVKIGTTQAQRKLFFNLKKEKERLEREGFYPAPRLLAEKLNVKENEVVEMEQRLGSADLSVDMPVGDDSDANLLSVLPSNNLSAEELMERKEMRSLLSQSLENFASSLKEKELIIFRERMLSEEKATLQQVAEKLSLSKERVRQIEEKIKSRLKDYLLEKFDPSVAEMDFE